MVSYMCWLVVVVVSKSACIRIGVNIESRNFVMIFANNFFFSFCGSSYFFWMCVCIVAFVSMVRVVDVWVLSMFLMNLALRLILRIEYVHFLWCSIWYYNGYARILIINSNIDGIQYTYLEHLIFLWLYFSFCGIGLKWCKICCQRYQIWLFHI